MGGGDKAPASATAFFFKRILPWLVLLGTLWYVFTMGRTYLSQVGSSEPPNPLVTKQTTPTSTKPKTIGKVKVISDWLNFRTTPSTSSGEVISRLRKGDVLDVLANQKKWYKVQNAQGTTGYVFSDTTYVVFTPAKRPRK